MSREAGKGDKRRLGKGYEENYDRIFGEKKAVSSRLVVHQGKLVDISETRGADGKIHILGDIEPFKSPITGEWITSRSQLRQHQKEHGVTDSRDYSPEFFQKRTEERLAKMEGRTREDRIDRIERIKYALDKHR